MGTIRGVLPQALEAMERGATVITANQRSARSLRQSFDADRHGSGATLWQSPEALAWGNWTAGLWHQLLLSGEATSLPLNRTQELALWREVLHADATLSPRLKEDTMAELAADAWQQLHRYGHGWRVLQSGDRSESADLLRWAEAFERRCRRNDLLSAAALEARLAEAVRAGKLRFEAESLFLLGFDRMSPAQEDLLAAAREAGVRVDVIAPPSPASQQLVYSAGTAADELLACAHWTRQQLAADPGARIAIIVPQMAEERVQFERVLREVLAPELNGIETPFARRRFEFSLGTPLARTASVAAALYLLQWSAGALPLRRVSDLLRSKFLDGEGFRGERSSRAELDTAVLRRAPLLLPEISLRRLLGLIEAEPARAAKLRSFTGVLRALERGGAAMRQTQAASYTAWADRFRDLLEAAKWNGTGDTSFEVQARSKWSEALDTLATLDFQGSEVSFDEALADLRRIADATLFAPESEDAPVQVMGPLEAAGSSFDAVWFLRCGEGSWPQTPAPNALLPWRLRRRLRTPGGDPATDRQLAQGITNRIASSGGTVVFSFCRRLDRQSQRISPLLRELRLSPLAESALPISPREHGQVLMERITEQTPIPPPPDAILRGGARVLELQAACGFRAFSELRLRATEPEPEITGLSPRDRGTLLHAVLDLFWKEVQSQDRLRSMSHADRSELLHRCIREAMAGQPAHFENGWGPAYLEVQHLRLHNLLVQWIEVELDRSPFEVTHREENAPEVAVGPLRLRLRVDRLDATEGGVVLIDYKTGDANPSSWKGDRMDAPQLPLYSLLPAAGDLAGIAFGVVRPGKEMKVNGFQTSIGLLHNRSRAGVHDLEAKREEWRVVLDELATRFYQGDVRVDPKQPAKTCKYCASRPFCRFEATAWSDVPEEEPQGEHE